jgi:hypothetical protein
VRKRRRLFVSRNARFVSGGAPIESDVSENRFRKRHPFDCGRTRCQVCHSEKVHGRKSVTDRRSDEAFANELAMVDEGSLS